MKEQINARLRILQIGRRGNRRPRRVRSMPISPPSCASNQPSRRPGSASSLTTPGAGLELAGIEFIDENGGGSGVRLRKRPRAKPAKS
jgi:hypothetical protein